jgi:hypothetical protein
MLRTLLSATIVAGALHSDSKQGARGMPKSSEPALGGLR